MQRVAARRILRNRIAKGLYGSFLVAMLLAFIPAFQYAAAGASESGFWDYLSLIVSDGAHLSNSWHALALSLAESAPIAGVVSILAIAVGFAYSARKLVVISSGTNGARLAFN